MEPSPPIPPSIQTFSKILPTPIDIIAIEGGTPEVNGVSRPFRGIGEDEAEYFVKLKNTGWIHLVDCRKVGARNGTSRCGNRAGSDPSRTCGW